MLMSAKVVDDAASLLAINHVCVKAARVTSFEISDPGYGLPAEWVQICVIPDGERDRIATFREHNSPPAADVEKRQSEELAAPNFDHHSCTNRYAMVFAAEAATHLN